MGPKLTVYLATVVQQFIAKTHKKTNADQPFLPDLDPIDFFLFLEVKNEAGWQGPDPGHHQKQLGWGHQEAEQRRLHHCLGEAHRSLQKVHLPRGQIYEEKLKNTLVSILFTYFAIDTFRVKLKHTTYI